MQMRKDLAELEQAVFVDFNDAMSEMSIDDSVDWLDPIHFNCRGAEKFSRYLADFLCDELRLDPTEGEDEALWQSRVDHFAAKRGALDS